MYVLIQFNSCSIFGHFQFHVLTKMVPRNKECIQALLKLRRLSQTLPSRHLSIEMEDYFPNEFVFLFVVSKLDVGFDIVCFSQ